MSAVPARSSDTNQTQSLDRDSFPNYLRAFAATALSAHSETPPSSDQDFAGLKGISSTYRKEGRFSERELAAIGEVLFQGPAAVDTISPLLGLGQDELLRPIMERLEALALPQNLAHLAKASGIPVDFVPTADSRVVALVLRRSDAGEILNQVMYYEEAEEQAELLARDRVKINPLGARFMPSSVESALLEQAIVYQESRGVQVAYQDAEGEGIFLEAQLEQHPFSILHDILRQTPGTAFSTPMHFTVEFEMMLAGLVLPSQDRLTTILDAFYPEFTEYAEGMRSFVQRSFDAHGGEGVTDSKVLEKSEEARARQFTKLDMKYPLTRYLLESLHKRKDVEPFMSYDEIQQVREDRLNFLRAYKRSLDAQLPLEQRLESYSIQQLIRGARCLTGILPQKLGDVIEIKSAVLLNFERGKKWLAPEEVFGLIGHFGELSKGEADTSRFVDALMEKYSSTYARR